MRLVVEPRDVLVVVDMQYDFLPGGSLAVAGGDEIIAVINGLAESFFNVVLTQDWHPGDHISFAANHPGKKPFETITLPYGSQVLWPIHCVQDTHGAELCADLVMPHAQLVIRKGYDRDVDSYSGFREADRTTPTGLAGYLRERQLGRVFVCGLATDFCVSWTAIDARELGFATYLIDDASRAIDTNGSLAGARAAMAAAGVVTITSADIA